MNEIILNSHNKSLIRKKRFWNISLITLLLIGIIFSSKIIDINSSNLLNGIPRLGDYVSQILPSLETSNLFLSSNDKGSIAYWYFNLPKYLKLLFETFNMALLATIIGSTLALFLSFLAAKNTSPNSLVFFTIRRILEFFRGVPEIIFAILFVWVLGIGPLAGIIAMTLHTTGSLGKLFSEVHENSNDKPIDALKASGGNWLSEMKFGLLPQVLPNIENIDVSTFVDIGNDIKAAGSGGLSLQTDEGTKRIFIADGGEVKVGQLSVGSATTAPLHVAKASTDCQAIFGDNNSSIDAVSYTHLTLPTILLV